MGEKVFLNSKVINAEKAQVSARDSGFLYGAGLFETMQCRNGVVFALTDHLDRLFYSARKLQIKNIYDKKYIADAVYETLGDNKLSDARIRLTLTNGDVGLSENPISTLLITATKFQGYPPEYYEKGIGVILSSIKQNATDPTTGHKTTNYFSRLLALDAARKAGAVEALFFTTDNKLAEGCISNVFLVKDSVLYTPPIEAGILAGIARKTVCLLALKNSLALVEQDLFVSDLLGAEEVFVTNVIMQVLPVTVIEKHQIGDGKPGALTKKLAELFEEEVKVQCNIKTQPDSEKSE